MRTIIDDASSTCGDIYEILSILLHKRNQDSYWSKSHELGNNYHTHYCIVLSLIIRFLKPWNTILDFVLPMVAIVSFLFCFQNGRHFQSKISISQHKKCLRIKRTTQKAEKKPQQDYIYIIRL